MAAANPQPLRVCPFEEHGRAPVQIEDDDAMDDVEDGNTNRVRVAELGLGGRGAGGIVMASRTSELTLSFEGEVYVFPAVTPEKPLASAVPAAAPAPNMDTVNGSDYCGRQFKALSDCLNNYGSEIGKCKFNMDMLQECRRSSGSASSA